MTHCIPIRTRWCFSSNKPCITPDIKALLKGKKRASGSGNKDNMKTLQHQLKRRIRKNMVDQLQQNNLRGV